jgi:predicted ATPase/DNA-binding CsgD family transcriptional regulator
MGGLPTDAMEIIGRRIEVSKAKRLLAESRLLMLTGVGGVGKTRLALRVAADVQRAFDDGAWLVELASLHDEELLARTVSTALGSRDQSARPSAETLAEHLRDKRLLLVLDNCEHLLDACAVLVSRLLPAAPGLRVLATSREPLSAIGETVLVVPPLTVPVPRKDRAVGELSRVDAVRLFTERARAAVPGFTVDAANGPAVARLCRRLEGIPLAIELAAVRLRTLSLDEILDRLDDRYRFLTDGDRTALPRQRTLRATVEWSFELCSPAERLMWERLSVFSGGFELPAAEHVCAGGPIRREHVLDLVAGLADKSIVTWDAQGRYGMLETLREYGRERLAAREGEAVPRGRHRDHYLRLVEQADRGWFGPDQETWIAGVRRELPNIRTALDFCLREPGEARTGMRIATMMHEYWVFLGAHTEARYWLDQALELTREAPTGPDRVEALAVNAAVTLLQGDMAGGPPLMDACRAEARRLGDDATSEALVAQYTGLMSLFRGDLEDAMSALETAIDRFDADRDRNDLFLAVLFCSMAATLLGHERAGEIAADCLRRAEEANAGWAVSWGKWAVGFEAWRSGDAAHAIACFREGLRHQYSLDDRWGPAWNLEVLGWATVTEVRAPRRAARLLGAAESARQAIGVALPGFRPYADLHDRSETRLRAELGDDAYAAAFRAGRELDFTAAIAFALEEGESAADAAARPASEPRLTPRETQVAALVAEGLTNRQVATRLTITRRTAESHVENILTKLGLTSRTQIAIWVMEQAAVRR